MKWLAIACSAENEVLAWHEKLAILESACQDDFRAICRIYSTNDNEVSALESGNRNFRIEFDGPKNTKFVPYKKSNELLILSDILQFRVLLMSELHQRLAHGFKRFESLTAWQVESYEEKYKQALSVINNYNVKDVGMVEDHAEENGLNLNVAAGLIINKYENRKHLIRKLERLRIRHQIAIRKASSKEAFEKCRTEIEADAFLTMMM